MLTNLFSVFDPVSSVSFTTNWLVLGVGMLVFPYLKYSKSSRVIEIYAAMINMVYLESKVLLPLKSRAAGVYFLAIFIFIVLLNSGSLLPFVFTATGHLAVTLSLALPLWVGYYLQGWIKHSGHMLAHLVPLGTPPALMPFMVVIESVSGVIRPLTLAVRLAANMVAGHLLLTLMSSAVSIYQPALGAGIVLSQVLLVVLEAAVAVIQGYVFITLSVLYTSEVYDSLHAPPLPPC